MTVMQRISNDEFKPKAVLVPFPAYPAIMSKQVGSLTPDELASLPAIVEAYNAAKLAASEALDAYRIEEGRLWNEFTAALHAEHGMTDHPKASLLYAKAYEMGHSAGMSEVANYYVDLIELVR